MNKGIVYPGLKEKRLAAGLTQLACAVHFGVSPNAYRFWEWGFGMTAEHYEAVVACFGEPDGGKP